MASCEKCAARAAQSDLRPKRFFLNLLAGDVVLMACPRCTGASPRYSHAIPTRHSALTLPGRAPKRSTSPGAGPGSIPLQEARA